MANTKLIAQLKALENIPWIAPVAAAERVAEIARNNAPVDTGFLRDHIFARHLSKSSEVVSEAPYSGFVEFGTRFMAAQPFLRPAVDENNQEILAAVAESIIGQIKIILRGGTDRGWRVPPATSSEFPGMSAVVQKSPGRPKKT